MSVSMYSGQVDRLTGDIAGLRSKLADERRKAADATSKAVKATQALGKATSTSQVSSRGRELERYQKQAAGHERKATDLEKQIANKQKSLTASQASLDRAQREQQKKDDRETEKRRRAELDHIRRLERERRGHTSLPAQIIARPEPPDSPPQDAEFTDTYDVCLSFAGEQRDYVELIAGELKKAGLKVFYDQDEDIAPRLWGRDLGEYLDYIYRQASRFCLMFISSDYAEKAWTKHERRSALARMIEEGGDYLLPARFDDTELPGLRPTTGYLDLREVAPNTLVHYVIKKLEEAA
jgi:TolA-binding protein